MLWEVAKWSAANWHHGSSTPTVVLTEPPSLPATFFFTLGLWLDGSIIILFVGYGEIGSCPIFWVGKDRLTTFQSLAAAWQVVAYRCTRLCSSQSQRESIWRMGIHLSRGNPVFATQRKTGQEFFVLSPCSPWEYSIFPSTQKTFLIFLWAYPFFCKLLSL